MRRGGNVRNRRRMRTGGRVRRYQTGGMITQRTGNRVNNGGNIFTYNGRAWSCPPGYTMVNELDCHAIKIRNTGF